MAATQPSEVVLDQVGPAQGKHSWDTGGMGILKIRLLRKSKNCSIGAWLYRVGKLCKQSLLLPLSPTSPQTIPITIPSPPISQSHPQTVLTDGDGGGDGSGVGDGDGGGVGDGDRDGDGDMGGDGNGSDVSGNTPPPFSPSASALASTRLLVSLSFGLDRDSFVNLAVALGLTLGNCCLAAQLHAAALCCLRQDIRASPGICQHSTN